MGDSKIFKCGFDITDYKDILPDIDEYRKNDFIINEDEWGKGNIDNCIWLKHIPTAKEISSPEFRAREAKRILKTGAWICISEEILWLSPSYYFGLAYGKVGSDDWEFRLKRLMHYYFKIRARNNKHCKGTLTLKNRADGETTSALTDAFWECADGGETFVANLGIQSKTNKDAINPCWSTVQVLWQSLPQWLKGDLFSDMVSGSNIAEKMQFMREADDKSGKPARNIRLEYYPATHNAMDGKHNVKKAILDEICKWKECSFYDTYSNYSKFIMPGFQRRGMFDMFSSPADFPCKSNEEVYTLWQDSNTDELVETGTTKSGIHRYYSNPLHGVQGAYDKFGDADPQAIYDWIMRTRKNTPKEKLMGEIRGFPLNESEMFDSTDGGEFWDGHKYIQARKIYLLGTRYKDNKTKEPTVVYGNLEWKDGIKDSEPVFRMSDKNEFDVHEARFCFSYLPKNREPLKNIFTPPSYIEDCVGIDSVDKRYANKRHSNFAMVNTKFRDLHETGIVKCPTMIYCNRPLPIEISYEDAIKFCVFNRSMAQVEALNTKIVDYFEDRNYLSWMISKIGMPKNSLQKGDAPSGKSAFMDEIIGLLNAATNIPADPDEPHPLELNWFEPLLSDILKFNRDDTHANDLSMAWGQSLLGVAKLLFKKQRPKSSFNDRALSYWF